MSSGTIERVFQHKDAIARHKRALMLVEREVYLSQLLDQGRTTRAVAECASTLCYVLDFLDSARAQVVTEARIAEAAARWLTDATTEQQYHRSSVRQFKAVARSWSRFLGLYAPEQHSLGPFQAIFEDFMSAMWSDARYRPASIRSLASPVRLFLVWAHSRRLDLHSVSLVDLHTYIHERRVEGCSTRTLNGQCSALRTFLAYVGQRGMVQEGLGLSFKNPHFARSTNVPSFPSWRDVRRMIASLGDHSHSAIRAKAVLLLAAVYGLRCAEIVRLTLDDFDWYNEILTVQRAKRGRIQQFPLQYEVGEAIIRYLTTVRPPCRCRNLFVTLKTPYRSAENLGPAMRTVLRAHGMITLPCGLHALRHACATELLRRGTSLRRIADFLGHRGIRSVDIYARSDLRALRKVAEVDLRSVL